jgi:hypothetical protein
MILTSIVTSVLAIITLTTYIFIVIVLCGRMYQLLWHNGRVEVQNVSHFALSIVRLRKGVHVKFNIYAGVIPGFWCRGVTPI